MEYLIDKKQRALEGILVAPLLLLRPVGSPCQDSAYGPFYFQRIKS